MKCERIRIAALLALLLPPFASGGSAVQQLLDLLDQKGQVELSERELGCGDALVLDVGGNVGSRGPIFSHQPRYLFKVAPIAGDECRTRGKRNRCNAQIKRADAYPTLS